MSKWKYTKVGREVRRRVLPTGFDAVKHAGYEDCEIEALVDVDYLIHQLGGKAMRSKRGVSRLADGAILVRVVSRKKVA